MYVCNNKNKRKEKCRIFYHRTKKEKEKRRQKKELLISSFSCPIFIYHHHIAGTAGTAARPQAVNPRKMARVTSPSPRLPGKKDFPKKKEEKQSAYI